MTRERQFWTVGPVVAILIGLAVGCTKAADRIPREATLVASQSGGMGFLSRDKGTVYLVDSRTGQVVYTAAVAYGDKLAFLPEQKQVLFNGNVVSQPELNAKHVYRLFFLRE
ncbi:MAG: hypothetical protein NTU53_21740 [Planctomycetota bacterium]|nr:hypothetical protein [Planctomycetota bacterium]